MFPVPRILFLALDGFDSFNLGLPAMHWWSSKPYVPCPYLPEILN
jgi:hypothetical protein